MAVIRYSTIYRPLLPSRVLFQVIRVQCNFSQRYRIQIVPAEFKTPSIRHDGLERIQEPVLIDGVRILIKLCSVEPFGPIPDNQLIRSSPSGDIIPSEPFKSQLNTTLPAYLMRKRIKISA